MAKTLKHFNLVQGSGENTNVVPVTTKTTTENYFKKLIADYRRIGRLDSREVEIVPVRPQFS